jgi:hypothetical protein
MGAKRMLDEGPAASAHGLYVCSGCIEECALQEVIAANAVDENCNFCTERNADEPIAPLRGCLMWPNGRRPISSPSGGGDSSGR